MGIKSISKSTLQRLPTYLTYLKSLPAHGPLNISSVSIASALNMGEVQIRKDLASVSGSGKPKIGYIVSDLIKELEEFLGCDDVNNAVIVGAGKLGKALLDYKGFGEYGLNIVAGFDIDESKEGKTMEGSQIFSLSKFENLCSRLKIKIGIITVPAECAQTVCDLMVKSGILAILNFAPTHLVVPDNILVHNQDIAASLSVLSNHLKEQISKNKV
jgi:AT-rich DNA-binding protein